jgi:hypothetical protein
MENTPQNHGKSVIPVTPIVKFNEYSMLGCYTKGVTPCHSISMCYMCDTLLQAECNTLTTIKIITYIYVLHCYTTLW